MAAFIAGAGIVGIEDLIPSGRKRRIGAKIVLPLRGAGSRTYTMSCPVWRANSAWIWGDLLWATGLPMTAYKSDMAQ